MFTGLVEAVGTVRVASGRSPKRITIVSSIPNGEMNLGDSVAINGVCLTVVEISNTGLTFEAATETLQRTTLGALKGGDRVNLERALRVGDRLGGHMVSGHVDGIGVVRVKQQKQSALYLGIEAPDEVARLTVARGSITVAGVSLTVTDVQRNLCFIGLIPHTLKVTNLDQLAIGTKVNLEADLIARYVEKITLCNAQNLHNTAPLKVER